MAHRQIEKRLAAQLLEATKSVLDHVSRWMVELNQSGKEPPDGLARIYGRARRLRDYLHRSAAAYGRTVSLDLSEDDEDLLVSCIVHHLGVVEAELTSGKAADTGWLEDELKNLGQCAIDLATRPVNKIPAKEAADQTSPTVRSVMSAIARKTARLPGDATPLAEAQATSGIWPTQRSAVPTAEWAPAPSPPPLPEEKRFHVQRGPTHPFDADQAAAHAPESAPNVPTGSESGQFQVQAGSVYPSYDPTPPTGGDPAAAPPGQPSELAPIFEPTSGPSLLDPARITDPRLRTMIAMDQSAFDSTRAAESYRLAMVHLSSVFEAAVVDYAMPRQKELGVKGPPETWRIERVIDTALEDRLNSRDRPYLLQLVAARHLIRPAVQLMSPMVVTPQTLDRVVAFVRRVLVELGYAGSASVPGGVESDLESSGLMAAMPPPEAPAPPRLPPRPGQGPGAPTYS